MRDRVNRRQVLASASGALAFTALPKLPAVASIVAVPVSPPASVSPMFDGLEILNDDLKAAFDKVLNARTGFVEGDGSLRQVLIQAIEGHAQMLALNL
jgi:hypothetical protein